MADHRSLDAGSGESVHCPGEAGVAFGEAAGLDTSGSTATSFKLMPIEETPSALAGVFAHFAVIMLLQLKTAGNGCLARGKTRTEDLLDVIREGAVLRVCPKAMTVAVILAGLLPIMWSTGTGSEVMHRLAAPMVGGIVSAPLLSVFVIPAAYLLMRRPREAKASHWVIWRSRRATA